MNAVLEQVLLSLETTRHEFWNLSRKSANFLSLLIKTSGAKKVLEIGTSNGYSSLWIAAALEETGGKLTTIEFWDKRQSIAKENFAKCGFEADFRLGSASDILKNLLNEGASFDFAFIDANKLEYVKYFEFVDKMLTEGGIILADNITSHPEKVKPFVDLVFSRNDYQSEILDLPDGMLLARKTPKTSA